MKVLVAVLMLALVPSLGSQEISANKSSNTTIPSEGAMPVEYRANEFPDWAVELRRAEIIAVGAFPFVFLFSGLSFDIVYWSSNGFLAAYLPWPVGPGTSSWTVTANANELASKNLVLVTSTLLVSIAISLADYALRFWLPEGNS